MEAFVWTFLKISGVQRLPFRKYCCPFVPYWMNQILMTRWCQRSHYCTKQIDEGLKVRHENGLPSMPCKLGIKCINDNLVKIYYFSHKWRTTPPPGIHITLPSIQPWMDLVWECYSVMVGKCRFHFIWYLCLHKN